jgi:DNA repair exonuclease SbcCD nuclease subunit
MGKMILTGDFHAQKGIKIDILINYLKYVHNYCIEEDIRDIIVLGDLFEKSSSIKNEAFIPLVKQLYLMKDGGINFIIIIGNHDAINKDNDSIVEVFSSIATIVKDSFILNDMAFVSYTKEESKFAEIDPEKIKYLFTHVPIADFSFDNAYHATEKHAFKTTVFEDFQFVFTGHFHRHQSKKNIVYVGSPYQMNFGEIGQEKGFVVFDSDLESWKFVKYDGPEFIKFNVTNFKDFNVSNKFVGVIVDTKIQNYVKLKRVLFERGAIDVIPFFEKKECLIETSGEEELKLNSINDIIKEYLLNVKKDGIDNKILAEKFEGIIYEV